MKLELANFPVKDVKFSRHTSYKNGVLEIDKEELLALILEDKKVASANLDIAFPGEQTRIVNICDAVEPRVKVSGPGCIFPGVMGPVETVGEGRTHKLSGVTVMPSVQYAPEPLTGPERAMSGILDMWGPGALVTPLASTINIVLILKLVDGITDVDAQATIQLAEFRVAQRLAETTRDKAPQDIEVFELSPVDPSLPRVAYILQCMGIMARPLSLTNYYGFSLRESFPTLVHPNEIFDGAVTPDARQGLGWRATSWAWLNQPMVLGLLREHGKRLNFLGIILQKIEAESQIAKQASAESAAKMAQLLHADGAVITRITPSGNSFVETMLAVQACERKGVKTVLLTVEWGKEWAAETPLPFYVPEATAMVSTGSFGHEVKLPAPSKVIGCKEGELVNQFIGPEYLPFSPWSEHTCQERGDITGGCDWWGSMYHTCKAY